MKPIDKTIQQNIHHYLITVHQASEALLTQYRENVPRLNHPMDLEDIAKAQYYLEQAKLITELIEKQNQNNILHKAAAKKEDDLETDDVVL